MSNTQQTLAQMIRAKHPGAYDDMDDMTLEKNVLAKYPQYGDLPRTTATPPKESYTDFLARTGSNSYLSMSPTGIATSPKIPASTQAEAIGGALGGEAALGIRGLTGVVLRVLGAGTGAAAGNVAGQAAEGNKPNLSDTAKSALLFSAFQAGGETLGALKGALSRIVYTGKVAADGTPEMTKLARSILHPTEMPENIMRAVVPPPEEAVAAAKAQAGEANAAKLEAQMTEAQAARQKELAQWERLKNQEAQSLMNRGRQQLALDAAVAKNAPPANPFEGATSSATPVGNAGLPQGSPTLFPQKNVQMVSKFEPPAQGKIVSPESAPPDIKVTYQSVPQAELLGKVKSGDLAAIREWQRRGLELPANVRFLTESARAKPWRNLNQ